MKHLMKAAAAVGLCCAAALCFDACGKKHIIEATPGDALAPLATGTDAVVYENVTDRNGENVTTPEGEIVTVAVPRKEATNKSGKTEADTTKESGASAATTNAAGEKTSSAQVPATSPEETVAAGEYVVTLKADKTEVSVGDTLTVTYHLKNCRNVACASFIVEADKGVSIKDYKSKRYENEDGDFFDLYSNSTDEGVLFGGMITTTCDFEDADLFTVTYQVDASAKKGTKLVFRVDPTTFLVGTDDSGKTTKDICAALEKASVTVTVK